jgi:hypothetical protein
MNLQTSSVGCINHLKIHQDLARQQIRIKRLIPCRLSTRRSSSKTRSQRMKMNSFRSLTNPSKEQSGTRRASGSWSPNPLNLQAPTKVTFLKGKRTIKLIQTQSTLPGSMKLSKRTIRKFPTCSWYPNDRSCPNL